MRNLRGYQGKHRHQHAPVSLIIGDHRENPASNVNARPAFFRNPAFGRPGALRLGAAAVAIVAAAPLLAGTAAPAGAAAQQPAPASPGAVATAARYVHVRDGHLTLDTRDAENAGALAAGTSLVASLNTQLAHPRSRAGIVLDAAQAGGTLDFITLIPGVTLSVTSTEVQLNLTKGAVTEIQEVLGLSQGIASLVGSILGSAQVQGGPQLAAVVASSLTTAGGLLKSCVAPDGSLTVTVPLNGIPVPSCGGTSPALA